MANGLASSVSCIVLQAVESFCSLLCCCSALSFWSFELQFLIVSGTSLGTSRSLDVRILRDFFHCMKLHIF
ncbi:unnamed protein product [Camellia sinensis]